MSKRNKLKHVTKIKSNVTEKKKKAQTLFVGCFPKKY